MCLRVDLFRVQVHFSVAHNLSHILSQVQIVRYETLSFFYCTCNL